MMQSHEINIHLTAPYYTLNELTEKTERVWLAFHGYGQLTKYFIKKFEQLDPEKNFVIAPEGLSKFYVEGFTGRIGASWMTKENRLMEIENQHAYLQAILKEVGDFTDKQLVYFGFSQGAATMCRFAASSRLPFEKMVLWAGEFPPDSAPFDFLSGKEEIHYFTSKEDTFFKEGMVEKQEQMVKEKTNLPALLHWYDGGHRVIPELVPTI